MSRYRDHSSPVRRARAMARARLPCGACGGDGEPPVRSPRPYSPAWEENPGAFFACPACGVVLARLEGSAATRRSDLPGDYVPYPAGLIHRATASAWERSVAGQTRFLSELVRELTVTLDHGNGCSSGFEVREGVPSLPGRGLAGIPRPRIDLVLYRLAMPWVMVGVALREHRDEVRRRLLAAADRPALEAVFLVSRDSRADRTLQIEEVSAAPGARPQAACRRH